jgi:LysR family nitrogen assimilation transcriptional regulator
MDVATLFAGHYVLSLGSVREAARVIGRPPSSVSAAVGRLQDRLATTLTSQSGSRLLPTLEGRRVAGDLQTAAHLALDLAELAPAPTPVEHRAARLSVTLLALARFAAVARVGSIRAAAGELEMGQPQLTRQMRGLEAELGTTLFERRPTGVVTTAAGARLVAIAEALTALWARMAARSDDRFRLERATTRLGAVPPLGRDSRIARILARLAAEWPRRRPREPLFIASNTAEQLLLGVKDGSYDVALLDTEEVPADLERRVISRSRLALVGAKDLIAASGGDLVRLLTTHPMAAPSRRSGLRQKLVALTEDLLTPAEQARVSLVEIDSIPVIANLVLEHGYVALMPESAYRADGDDLAGIPVPDRYDMRLTLVWRATPHAVSIVATLAEILSPGDLWPVEPIA